jgi:arylsulfatase A-like enzyme
MLFSIFLFAFLTFANWLAVGLNDRVHQFALLILGIGLAVVFTHWFHKHQIAALRFWRKSLPFIAAIALLAFIGIQGTSWLRERIAVANLPAAVSGTPSILVIVIDTLRADHLSIYGYQRLTSPNIARLAKEGVIFETAISTAPWTLPSHASMLTGRFPHEHGVERSNPRNLIDSPYPTLAEALRNRGYRTAAFSANTLWFTREQGFGRGFTHFEDYFQSVNDMAVRTIYGAKFYHAVLQPLGFVDIPARKRAIDINRSLIRWVEGDSNRPFFAFLHYFDVHEPYFPPQPYRSKFSNLENQGGILNGQLGREDPQMTAKELQSEVDAYDGAISYVDDQIAQLMSDLRNLVQVQATFSVKARCSS